MSVRLIVNTIIKYSLIFVGVYVIFMGISISISESYVLRNIHGWLNLFAFCGIGIGFINIGVKYIVTNKTHYNEEKIKKSSMLNKLFLVFLGVYVIIIISLSILESYPLDASSILYSCVLYVIGLFFVVFGIVVKE